MALPKQVQAQAKAADDFDAQIRASQTPETDPPKEDTDPEPPTEPAAPEPPKPQDPPAPKPVADDAEVWKQRFKSLQGMYEAQVPALQAQIKALTASLTELQASAKPPKAPEPDKPLVTKSDVEAFGEDLVDMARRVAREEFGKERAGYQEEITQLRNQLAAATGEVGEIKASTAETARETFFDRLGQNLPTWQQVQATAECQEFLASKIPGTRQSWNDALVSAAGAHDLSSVLEVFGAFFEKHPELNPKAKPQPTPKPQSQELRRQTSPSRTQASSAPSQKRTYTAAEYASESMRIIRMNQQGKYQEAAALEAELNLAQAEGRLTP